MYSLYPTLFLLTAAFSGNLKGAPAFLSFNVNHPSLAALLPAPGHNTWDSIMPVLPPLHHLHAHPPAGDLPAVPLNPQASQFVNGYLQKNNEALQKIKKKSQPYFRIIETVFQKHGLPVELKYLAVVESELKKTAVSRMGAAGPWQLMPATARELGLTITSQYDERRHYYKSTTAAATYLKRLYAAFDDWLLVIAAYNSGPGTVYKAIRKSGSRNFWQLQYFLPAETRLHVKRFIGTHYYFEEEGSATTLTKTELAAYKKAVAAFEASFTCNLPQWKLQPDLDAELPSGLVLLPSDSSLQKE